ncbi:tetratricopeptide repeat-containing sulfotransferase family protein [Oceanicoccus sagamiensis]|nr:sulfotransferase [Oceanicoccus sagamiensis]
MAIKKNKKNLQKKRLNKILKVSKIPGGVIEEVPSIEVRQLVSKARQENRVQLAEHLLLQLIDQQPRDSKPYLALLNLYSEYQYINEAAELVEKALLSFPRSTAVIEAAYSFYRSIHKAHKILPVLEKSIDKVDDKAPLYRIRAFLYAADGHKEEAVTFFKKALALNKADMHSYMGIVRHDNKNCPQSLIETLLKQLSNNDKLSLHEQATGYFVLAWYYEGRDQGLYWNNLHKANSLVATDYCGPKSYQNNHSLFNQDFPEPAAVERGQDGSFIFIIAPPRSGTTLLEQILAAHPATHGVGESMSVNYAASQTAIQFNLGMKLSDWCSEKMPDLIQSFRQYLLNFPLIKEGNEHVIIDKSIENYLYVGLILKAFPSAKIIRLKRHPLDTLLSCYHQFFASGYDHLFNLDSLGKYYVDFQRQMDYWEDAFPGKIHTVKYENLVSQQEQEIAKLLEYCQLPWDDACLQHHLSVSNVITASSIQVKAPVHTNAIAKWEQHKEQLQSVAAIINSQYPIAEYE